MGCGVEWSKENWGISAGSVLGLEKTSVRDFISLDFDVLTMLLANTLPGSDRETCGKSRITQQIVDQLGHSFRIVRRH